MKKLFTSVLFVIVSAFVTAQASAQIRFVEGEHYKVISSQATAKPEVKEFFSFWCPHCFNFGPLVAQMKKKNKAINEYRRFVNDVPNFIVNGKYQAQFTRDMTPDDMVDLIVFLSEMN